MLRYMPVVLLMVAGWALPTHAAGLEATYQRWERLRSPDTSRIEFDDGSSFLEKNPGWPEEKTIRLRTEAAALAERPSHRAMEPFCTDFPPLSGRGMVACAMANIGSDEQQTQWVKQGWLQGDFNADEEERIRDRYAKILTRDDHINRTERLLYEGSAKAAKRMLPLVPHARHRLIETRIAFLAKDRHAPRLLKQLSTAELRDPGILFERARWRLQAGDSDALAELITTAPKDAPYPDLWWPMRAAAARDAINKRNYKTALSVLAHHGDLKGEALAEALWLKGWILLRHRNDAGAAYKEFFALYTSVYTPVSKARAAYWAGRAAEKNGNKDIATEWMTKAARYPTVFYGQLARHWLSPQKPLALPAAPEATDAEKKQFATDDLGLVARALGKTGDKKMRDLFLAAIAARSTTDGQFALLAELGHDLGGDATGVEIAKLALRNNSVLLDAGWPRIAVPKNLPIELALTLAITRQESEFDPTARSTANARGLMQLLPSTAKHVARKLDINYRDSILEDPATNMTLGSTYLGQMINGFDGSYILGIASYNAGPGSVRKWIAARGMPPKNTEAAIDWIESIPFGETRNYVMRVLENVNVYRALANPEVPLTIDKDLIR